MRNIQGLLFNVYPRFSMGTDGIYSHCSSFLYFYRILRIILKDFVYLSDFCADDMAVPGDAADTPKELRRQCYYMQEVFFPKL